MIPLKLEFQAFGSYVSRQTVDFTRLENGDIFLINGKTGSGKTTIIDAMVFALYSKGSGTDRNALADMRSKSYGAEDIPTETSFTFEVKGKTYKFERRCWVRTKKKRDGTTEQIVETEQNAFELINDGFTPLFQNPKGKDLDSLAEELIGLNHEQFTKVMVLPQGKFESFLVAGSAEKEQILSTLFDVEKWHKIADWICKKAYEIQNNARTCENNCNETLKRHDCNDRNELTTLLKASEERFSDLEKQIDEKEKLTSELTTQKEKMLLLEENFLQLETLEKSFSSLDSQKETYKNLKLEIQKNKTALEIEPYYNFCLQYNKELQNRKAIADEVTVKLSDAMAVSDSLEKKLSEINSQQSEIDSDKVKLQKLIDNRENFSKLSDEKSLLSQAETQLQSVKNEIDAKNKQLSQLDKLVKNTESDRKIASTQLSKLTDLSKKKSQIDESDKLTGEISEISQTISNNNEKIAHLSEKISAKNSQLDDAQKHRDVRYNYYITNLASAISHSLTEGAPCPVCGSIHHPSPAKPPVDVATQEEIKKLDSGIDTLRKSVSQLENEKNLLSAENQKLETELSLKKTTLSQLENFTDEAKISIISEYNASMSAGEKLEKATQALEKLTSDKNTLNNALEQLKNSALDAETRKATSLAKIETFTAEIQRLGMSELTDINQLENSISIFTRKIDTFAKNKQEIEQNFKSASEKVITFTENKKTAFEEIEKASEKLKNAQNNYAEIMREKGFFDKNEYNAYHISREEISAKEKSYDEFIEKYNSQNSQLSQLREKLKGIERPDIEGISKQLSETEILKKALLTEKSSLNTSIETLTKDILYYDENYKNYREFSENGNRLSRFGRDIRGDNSIGLRRYVLGVMLDKIIDEANIILREIKGGQFSLFVHREKEGGKKHFGLEIFVLSTHAEHPYSVRSLSGGEKFLVAMALSMALSSIVQMYAGGIRIDALFIDEGFGTLDNDVLNDAMKVLSSVSQSRKVLGIISHVDILKDAIPKKINVISTPDGSRLSVDF